MFTKTTTDILINNDTNLIDNFILFLQIKNTPSLYIYSYIYIKDKIYVQLTRQALKMHIFVVFDYFNA